MGQGDRFRRKALKRGYKVDEVDEFLDRAEATLARRPTGEPLTAADIRDVVFRTRFGGYDEWQVDLHLDRLEKELDELASGLPPRGSNGFRALEAGPSAYREEREEVPAYPAAGAAAVVAPEATYGGGFRGETSGAYGRAGFREEAATGVYGQAAYREEPEPYREEPSYGGYREEPSYGGGYRGAEPGFAGGGYDRGPDYRGQGGPGWVEPQDPYREDPRYGQAAQYEGAPYQGVPQSGNPYQDPTYGGDRFREEPSYGGPSGPPGYRAPDRYGEAPVYTEQPSYGEGAPYADQVAYADRGGQYVEGPSYAEQAPYVEQYTEQPSYAEAQRYGTPNVNGYREGPSYAEGAPYQEGPSYAEGAPYSGGPYGSGGRGRGGYPEPAPYREAPSYGDVSPAPQFAGQYRTAEAPYRANGGRGGYPEPEPTGPQPVVSGVPTSGAVPPPRAGGRPGYGDSGFRELPAGRGLEPDFGRHGKEMTMEMGAVPGLVSPFTNEDKAVVAELRSSFRPRRFGSGYDPGQVERLFDAIQAMMEGRSGGQVSDSDLMPGQFGLVQGGYFEDDVDEALRQVRGLYSRRVG